MGFENFVKTVCYCHWAWSWSWRLPSMVYFWFVSIFV